MAPDPEAADSKEIKAILEAQAAARRDALWQQVQGDLRWPAIVALSLACLVFVANVVAWWLAGTPDAPVLMAIMVLVINTALLTHVQRQLAALGKLVKTLEDREH